MTKNLTPQNGDRVRLTGNLKSNQGTVIEGTLQLKPYAPHRGPGYQIDGLPALSPVQWMIEVLERPWSLPTTPGLYIVASEVGKGHVVAKLMKRGEWRTFDGLGGFEWAERAEQYRWQFTYFDPETVVDMLDASFEAGGTPGEEA